MSVTCSACGDTFAVRMFIHPVDRIPIFICEVCMNQARITEWIRENKANVYVITPLPGFQPYGGNDAADP
jgi:hypothetical protein